jgi:SET domain-containing protein
VCNFALHDIRAEEELTVDYRTFDAAWREKLGHLERAEPAPIS